MEKRFIIRKGNHYVSHGFAIFLRRKAIRFEAKFFPNCLYDDPQLPGQVNKLWGRSFGFHSKNSVRIGWRGCNQKIELFIYLHRSGKLEYRPLGECRPEEWVGFEIESSRQQVMITMAKQNPVKIEFEKLPAWGYRLYPYFGGKLAAPHDMEIRIRTT